MKRPSDLSELVTSEARVMLLYATREEAADILSAAGDLHLTGENFVWIVTQSVLGSMQQPNKFPVGMLGKELRCTYLCRDYNCHVGDV